VESPKLIQPSNKIERDIAFHLLKVIRTEFIKEFNKSHFLSHNDQELFEQYCISKHGIRLLTTAGGYNGAYEIVNESKFNLLILKYGNTVQ